MTFLDRVYARFGMTPPEPDAALPVRIPASHRNDLARLFQEEGFTQGAEIGVWGGEFSEVLCQLNPALHLLCIDPWVAYPSYQDLRRPQALPQKYLEAEARLAPYGCLIRREFSKDAAPTVPEGSLDFVFIDGNHAFSAVREDLALWCPRVRVGGVVAGHDYYDFHDRPHYARTIQVIPAVNTFVAEQQIRPWFVLDDCSFFWVKA